MSVAEKSRSTRLFLTDALPYNARFAFVAEESLLVFRFRNRSYLSNTRCFGVGGRTNKPYDTTPCPFIMWRPRTSLLLLPRGARGTSPGARRPRRALFPVRCLARRAEHGPGIAGNTVYFCDER